MSRCPIAGCTRARQGEMCKPHWYRVPKPVRDKLWAAWRAFNADWSNDEAREAYAAVQHEARELAS